MSEFQNREKAFEKKFELDEERRFKIASRTAYLFGLWAAGQIGLKGTEAEAYADQSVATAIAKSGHEQLIAKVEKDLQEKGIALTRHRLEKEFDAINAIAQTEIMGREKA